MRKEQSAYTYPALVRILLKTLRLVKYQREGKMVYYSLADDHILNLIREAQEHFAEGR